MERLTQNRVAVTGANGFIGRAVVNALTKAGADVTVILRSKHGAERLKEQGVTVLTGGLGDSETLKAGLTDRDILINLAYDMRASKEANLQAFEGLLTGARDAGITRIVHASSIVVYDDWPHSDLTENSPISTKTGGPYRQAKIEMEARLEQSGIATAILQPTIVYGPRSALWTIGLMGQLARGPVVLPDAPSVCNALYVEDLAQAFLRACVVQELGCERFIISGAERLSWVAFYEGYRALVPGSQIALQPLETLADRLGPAPSGEETGSGPSMAAKLSMRLRAVMGHEAFDRTVRAVKGLKPSKGPIYPNRSQLALFSGTGHCSIERARERLGYAPQFDLALALAKIGRGKGI